MAPGKKVKLSSAQEPRWTEIPGEELPGYRPQLQQTLEAVCDSQAFRTSPRSCEFIRHVTLRTLDGDIDELKERLIGMSLLGRDASYDTSTDSGVRVRANDVRKRLMSFRKSDGAELDFFLTLPPGSYVPRFFRREEDLPESVALPAAGNADGQEDGAILTVASDENEEVHEPAPALPVPPPRIPLSLFQLALPTLVAVFLCIVCMRWQLAQEHSFTSFWQQILQGDSALLYLPVSQVDGKQDLVAVQQLNEAAPLLDLAGQFHHRFTVVSAPRQNSEQNSSTNSGSNGVSIYVGDSAGEAAEMPASPDGRNGQFLLVNTPGGKSIVDRSHPARVVSRQGALLTIVNGTQRRIYIDGTDPAAIRSLVNRLCDEETFPGTLAGSFEPGTIVQAVFPAGTYAKAIIDREPLAGLRAALERLP